MPFWEFPSAVPNGVYCAVQGLVDPVKCLGLYVKLREAPMSHIHWHPAADSALLHECKIQWVGRLGWGKSLPQVGGIHLGRESGRKNSFTVYFVFWRTFWAWQSFLHKARGCGAILRHLQKRTVAPGVKLRS
jgi:hypothetical protein